MFAEKAQVATEYIIITGFILVIVTTIFAYSYVSNDQSIKISQANNSLDKLVNKADFVYALGPDNNQIVEVTFPMGITLIQDITVCNKDNHQQHYDDSEISCQGYDGVKLGAIEMQLNLIAGVSTIRRPAKAEIELDGFEAIDKDIEPVEGTRRIKVFWCGEKICLKRV